MATNTAKPAGVLSRFGHFVGLSAKPKGEDVVTTDEHDELEDKVETVEDKVEDLEDRVDDVEDQVDDDNDDDDDPDMPPADKPEARKAYLKGRANGRKAEKARAGGIMGLKAAASNLPLALHLAFDTNTSPKAALGTLQAAKAGVPVAAPQRQGSKLDGRMDGKKIAVGNDGGAGRPDPRTPEGASAFALAAAAKARGGRNQKEA